MQPILSVNDRKIKGAVRQLYVGRHVDARGKQRKGHSVSITVTLTDRTIDGLFIHHDCSV